MQLENAADDLFGTHVIDSKNLGRPVIVNTYLPPKELRSEQISLLLVNDGQDLLTMKFQRIIGKLYKEEILMPLFCVAIHCSTDRKNEYGTAKYLDYMGRGTKALDYQHFIMDELIPFLADEYPELKWKNKSFCGFSLGGLNALDMVWNHPAEFSYAGIFSGSLWWRNVSQDDPAFDEKNHRIMHNQIRNGNYYPGLKFFFETGTLDETADRNRNGIIDSIDDTLALIEELIAKGYDPGTDIRYLELKDGKHDVATWGKAFPEFLKWGWGREG